MYISHSRPWISDFDRQAVNKVLESGMISKGSKSLEFELAVTHYNGLEKSFLCTSGTAAIGLALQAIGITAGDEVILPDYVCENVYRAIASTGATPVLCDVNQYGVITPSNVATLLSPRTKSIIGVHIFGHVCDIEGLMQFKIPVIEDACQAFGLIINGKKAGSMGTLGIYSFHATKCFTSGEGGMLVSNDPEMTDKIEEFLIKTKCSSVQHNGISDLHAALGLSQLERYPSFIERRLEIKKQYDACINKINTVQTNYPNDAEFLFRYILKSQLPFVELKKKFWDYGIHIRQGVDQLLHKRTDTEDKHFSMSTELFESNFSIPYYPSLTNNEVSAVINALKEIFDGNRN